MSMNNSSGGRAIRTALVLCLACLYFLLAAGVALLGSGIYRSVAEAGDQRFTQRTALSYVANQVRRGDNGGIAVTSFDGIPALRLEEPEEDGYVYETWIYCYDGQLRELYIERGYEFYPEDGMEILALDSLDFAVEGGLLTVTASAGGESWSVALAPRTGIEEVARP